MSVDSQEKQEFVDAVESIKDIAQAEQEKYGFDIHVPRSEKRKPRDILSQSCFTKRWQKSDKDRKRARRRQAESRKRNRGKK